MLRSRAATCLLDERIAACEAGTVAITLMSMLLVQPSSSSLAPNPDALLTRIAMPPSDLAAVAI